MFFLYNHRIVKIYQFKKNFATLPSGEIIPKEIIDSDFWDDWEYGSTSITPKSKYWNFFLKLALFTQNSIPTELDFQ